MIFSIKKVKTLIDDNIIKEYVDQIKNGNDCKVVNVNVSALYGQNIKILFSELVRLYLEIEFNILIQNNTLEK